MANYINFNPNKSGYTFLSYIHASGTGGTSSTGQQIDTGLTFDMANDAAEITFAASNTTQDGMILANSNTTNHFWFYCYHSGNGINLYVQNNGSQIGVGSHALDTYKHTFRWENKTNYFDGVNLGTDSRSLGTTNTNLFIASWGGQYHFNGNIYNCKIWKSGVLVRNFQPARRDSDSVVGLYDLVNDVFYTNSGTGSFTAGIVTSQVNELYYDNFIPNYTILDYVDIVNPAAAAASQHNRIADLSITYNKIETELLRIGKGSSGAIGLSSGWWSDLSAATIVINNVSGTVYPTSLPENTWQKMVWKFNSSVSTLRICGWSDGTNYWTPQHLRYKYIRCYNGTTLVADLIPVKRNSDGVRGFYNRVNSTFYPNVGTGGNNAFVAGFTNGKEIFKLVKDGTTVFEKTYTITFTNHNCTPSSNYVYAPCWSNIGTPSGNTLNVGGTTVTFSAAVGDWHDDGEYPEYAWWYLPRGTSGISSVTPSSIPVTKTEKLDVTFNSEDVWVIKARGYDSTGGNDGKGYVILQRLKSTGPASYMVGYANNAAGSPATRISYSSKSTVGSDIRVEFSKNVMDGIVNGIYRLVVKVGNTTTSVLTGYVKYFTIRDFDAW